ncbi:MAG: transcriptional regulator [Deltaproteobacteria bacterium]|nr:transcriptional regulator [Deltaproteobacteria bacterium]
MSSLAVLMALRVRGRATPAAIAAAAGVTLGEARARVSEAVAAGLADADADRFVLSAAGHTQLAALLAREALDREALDALYAAFLTNDACLKARITAWQLAAPRSHSGGAANGTGDAPADSAEAAAAFADLRAVAAEAREIAARLAAVVPRHAGYARRLGAAVDALAVGDTRFVASPRVDSLHQVWFELHQDLLVTLGRERAG